MEALAVERTRAAIQLAVEQRLLETVAIERAERDAALERSEAFLSVTFALVIPRRSHFPCRRRASGSSRQCARPRRLGIIFVTAQNDPRLRAHLLEQGAVECLFKPFSDMAMLEALAAATA
jgi:CheY-like chemotaxis protein